METAGLARPAVPLELCRDGMNGRRLWIVGLPISIGSSLERMLESALHGTLAAARQTLTSLEGAFAAFLWDEPSHTLLVVNDFAGLQPLYVRREPGRISFAPRIDTLAAAGDPDPTGWGALVGFGTLVGERTAVEGVRRVPPAQVIRYHAASDGVQSERYWEWPEMQADRTLDRVDTGELLAILDANLAAYDVYGVPATLLLSGGFESRLKAALLTRRGTPPRALTLRNPYEHLEIDGRFAARVAQALGLHHEIRDPDPDFFSGPGYLDYVSQHELASPSVNLFIAQIASELRAANVRASWDGFPFGSIVKEKSAPTFEALFAKLLRGPESPAWRAARQVFSPAFAAAMHDGVAEAVAAERTACHPAPHGTQQFFHRNRVRHRIAPNTLKVYSSFLLPYVPGLTRAFYERVVPIPPAVRKGEVLYLRIFERHFPELARLPWCSGGHLMPGRERSLGYRALAARSAIVEHPRVGDVLRRLGITPSRPRSAWVDAAVAAAAPDDPHLNADGIRALQRRPPDGTEADALARELTFYWSVARGGLRSRDS